MILQTLGVQAEIHRMYRAFNFSDLRLWLVLYVGNIYWKPYLCHPPPPSHFKSIHVYSETWGICPLLLLSFVSGKSFCCSLRLRSLSSEPVPVSRLQSRRQTMQGPTGHAFVSEKSPGIQRQNKTNQVDNNREKNKKRKQFQYILCRAVF